MAAGTGAPASVGPDAEPVADSGPDSASGKALESPGEDTVFWLWDIDTDALPDMAESLRRLGYPPDALPPLQSAWNGLIHPDDLPFNDAAYQSHARGETPVHESRYRVRDAAGQWRWLFERGRVVERLPDGQPRRMVGSLTDITRRLNAQAMAQAAAARLEKIAAHVPGVLYQLEMQPDGRMRFLYISRQTDALFGVPAEVATSSTTDVFSTVFNDDRGPLMASVLESARTLGPWRHEFRLRRPDGAVVWVLGSSSPQRESDGRIVWHGYMQDVTERHDLEVARQSAVVAAAASRAKTDFLSRMSHELRTPLNAVLGFAQLMEIDDDEPPTERQRGRLLHIREAGDHLLQMIGELLDLTRIESGALALASEPVPLRTLAAESMAMVQPAADRAQVQLHLLASGDPAARVDRMRLRQVLLNLLSNAIKYNRTAGRVEVAIEALDGDRLQLLVRDNGVGIAESDLPRLFEPFHRGRHAGGPIDGTGIGLSLSRSLVTLMGGRLEVDSTLGVGSTFILSLQRA
jgi:PAS domain S-box-containing protein